MKTRLTAEQVADSLEDQFSDSLRHEQYQLACGRAADAIKKHLVPRWQDEPDADGWYWVEGYEGPRFIQFIHQWMHGDDQFMAYEISLNNRRVCPIGERPKDGGA